MQAVKKNLKFNEEKFTIGQNAKFAGLDLTAHPEGNAQIKPDRKKVEALCNIQRPSNKKEVMSLIGQLITYNKWVPDLSLKDMLIRDLGRKNALFKWTLDHQQCFEDVKEAVANNIPLEPYKQSAESLIFMDTSTNGVGFVLVQNKEDRVKIIAY